MRLFNLGPSHHQKPGAETASSQTASWAAESGEVEVKGNTK